MSIWVHTLIKNEERFIWYAIRSVVEHVDKVMVWDTGSTDNTTEIIRNLIKLYPKKIDFKEIGNVNPQEFTRVSQKMLDETRSDWFLILDGDEVWWEDSIKSIVDTINTHSNVEAIVQPYWNIVGDIYHYQSKDSGMYKIDGKKGFVTIRAISTKIEGLHYAKEHGKRGLYDFNQILVQERDPQKRLYLDKYYLHFTNMIRSSGRESDLLVPKRGFKYKHELGIEFPNDYFYPEVFFLSKPDIVRSVWEKRSSKYFLRAAIETPLKKVKRKLFTAKSGY